MLNERLEIARPFAAKIKSAETSMNASLATIAEMLVEIPSAREKMQGKIPLDTGADAAEALAQAALTAAQSYKQLVAAHKHLAEDRGRMGLNVVSIGDWGDCPEILQADQEDQVAKLHVA